MSNVSVRIGGRVFDRWQNYNITNDMLKPADAFSMSIAPGIKEIWDFVALDSEVEIRIDDNPILTGYIDERALSIAKDAAQIDINGRDKSGHMVDESADLQSFGAEDIVGLARKLAKPTFTDVITSNAKNRDLVRGRRSGKASASGEPIFDKQAKAPKKVEPGETRWDILQHFLEPARLLAWSTANGKQLVIGLPNYNQKPQFRFFQPAEGSTRASQGNILSCNVATSIANRFSSIRVTGASKGDGKNYGPRVTKHTATATDDSGDFLRDKQLILSDGDVSSESDAKERAGREIDLRMSERMVLELTVKGHSQRLNPRSEPALFAFDTMADVEIEPIGLAGAFLIVCANFSLDRNGGEITNLKLVPKGTVLTS